MNRQRRKAKERAPLRSLAAGVHRISAERRRTRARIPPPPSSSTGLQTNNNNNTGMDREEKPLATTRCLAGKISLKSANNLSFFVVCPSSKTAGVGRAQRSPVRSLSTSD